MCQEKKQKINKRIGSIGSYDCRDASSRTSFFNTDISQTVEDGMGTGSGSEGKIWLPKIYFSFQINTTKGRSGFGTEKKQTSVPNAGNTFQACRLLNCKPWLIDFYIGCQIIKCRNFPLK